MGLRSLDDFEKLLQNMNILRPEARLINIRLPRPQVFCFLFVC